MMLCDKCGKPFEIVDGFLLRNPVLGAYHICDNCGLALDRFIDTIDKAQERRLKKTTKTIR